MFFTKNEIIDFFSYPLTKQDFFIFEALLCGYSTIEYFIEYIQEETSRQASLDDFKKHLLKEVKSFYNHCQTCEQKCIENYHRRVPKAVYEELNIISDLPSPFHKKTHGHLYMIELASVIANASTHWLEQLGCDKEQFISEISNIVYTDVLDFFKTDCIKGCHYKCLKNCYSSSYCMFCDNLEENLPCPLKNEISIEEIKEDTFKSLCILK